MFTAALIFIAFISFLLILVVLIQNSKGGGVTAGFSGATNLIGVKRTGDLLENITWGLAITLIVSCMATNFIIDRDGDGEQTINSVNVERAQEAGFAPQQQMQQQEAPAGEPVIDQENQ